MRVARGQIWPVALDPTVTNEQRGTRPCIVVSGDRFNALPIRQAIVVPLTTRKRGFPHHIGRHRRRGPEPRQLGDGEAVRAVSTRRFGNLISVATDDTLSKITEQLTLWLADHD